MSRALFSQVAALPSVIAMIGSRQEAQVAQHAIVMHPHVTPPKGAGLVVPKRKRRGCNGAGCRTLDRCICDCKTCRGGRCNE